MRRRDLITLLGGASAAWPLTVRGQQVDRLRRIGVLFGEREDDPRAKLQVVAFEQALQARGWVKGRNVQFDYRWPGDDAALVQAYATELASKPPDVILSESIPILRVLKQATTTVPIVSFRSADPVRNGIVASLARPGGNITGFFANEPSLAGKWVDLISEIVPKMTRLGVVGNRLSAYMPMAKEPAQRSDVELSIVEASGDAQVESAIAGLLPVDGLLVLPGAPTTVHRQAIIAAAARHRLPALYPFPYFAEDGGLMSYGVDEIDLIRRAAGYVDLVLHGKKPADLPVQEPTKWALAINMKTAKTLGITVPTTLQLAADEVIE